MLFEIAAFVVSLLVLFYLWLAHNSNYWKCQHIPYIKWSFPFGNMTDVILMKKTSGEFYRDLYRKFSESPIGGFFKLGTPALLLRDPELIRTVLVQQFHNFKNNDFRISKSVDPLLGINPFAIQSDEWRPVRRIQLPSLTPNKVKGMFEGVLNCALRLQKWVEFNSEKNIETKEISTKFTGDTVAISAFGLDSDAFNDEKNAFGSVNNGEVFRTSYLDNLSIIAAMMAPTLGSLFRLRIIHKDVEDYFVRTIQDASQYRIKKDLRRNDFLQQLIDTNQKKGEKGYSSLEMAGHCMTFFMDGYETSGILLGWVLWELANSQRVQQKLREEIQTAWSPLQQIDYENLKSLSYLDNIISETLRLHPPIQSLVRRCTNATTLSHGQLEIKMKPGMSATVPILALHTDPKHFPDPDTFKPERFSTDTIARYAYLPFGEGPRKCVGIRYAVMQVKAATVVLMRSLRVEPMTAGQLVQLDPLSTFLHTAKGGLWVKFHKIE